MRLSTIYPVLSRLYPHLSSPYSERVQHLSAPLPVRLFGDSDRRKAHSSRWAKAKGRCVRPSGP